MLRIFFNPFEYIFLGFSLDSQGLPKDFPGFSLVNPCTILKLSSERCFRLLVNISIHHR